MPNIRAQGRSSAIVQIGGVLTIPASPGTTGRITRRAYPLGSGDPYPTVNWDGSTTLTYGPYDEIAVFVMHCDTGSMDYSFTTPIKGAPNTYSPKFTKTIGSYTSTTVNVPAGSTLTLSGAGFAYVVQRGSPTTIIYNGSQLVIDATVSDRIFTVMTTTGPVTVATGWFIPVTVYSLVAIDANKFEGNSGTTQYTFAMYRAGLLNAASTIDYTVAGFGANPANAADFAGGVFPSGTVSFAAGETAKTFTVLVNGDQTIELDEGFIVTATNPVPSNATIAVATATGTIINDDTGGSYTDPDLNLAFAFKNKIKTYDQGSGDRAAQLFASFDDLKAYLNVGIKVGVGTLTAGSTHPQWNDTTKLLSLVTASPNLTAYDVTGSIYVGAGVASDVTISNTRVRAKPDGTETTYKVQKDNSDINYVVNIADCQLENGQACDANRFNIIRTLSRYSEADNFKIGSVGGASKPQRIVLCWAEACGYNNPAAHGDGSQASSDGDVRIVATGFYSSPTGTPYSTNGYGLTNAIRIDASNGNKAVQRAHYLGLLSAHGGIYPIGVSPQQTDSVIRNVTIALCIFAPAAFRYAGTNDGSQFHPSFTDFAAGGGIMENIGIIGNEVFGYGPLAYNDRGAGLTDATGIWHWNPATIDADTMALWKDLGLLKSDGTPNTGMLRSYAGTITSQPKNVALTGAVDLGLDLSSVPNGSMITLHLPAGTNMNSLEYVA